MMISLFHLSLFLAILQFCVGFRGLSFVALNKLVGRNKLVLSDSVCPPNTATIKVADGLPEELRTHTCLYDMILVERFSVPETTKSGLYLPNVEKDEKHVAKVVAMPVNYGAESLRGNVVPIDIIAPFKVGDIVYVKDPWSPGSFDLDIDKRLFSFTKSVNVLGIVREAENTTGTENSVSADC